MQQTLQHGERMKQTNDSGFSPMMNLLFWLKPIWVAVFIHNPRPKGQGNFKRLENNFYEPTIAPSFSLGIGKTTHAQGFSPNKNNYKRRL